MRGVSRPTPILVHVGCGRTRKEMQIVMGEKGSVSVTSKRRRRSLLKAESVKRSIMRAEPINPAVKPMTFTSRDDEITGQKITPSRTFNMHLRPKPKKKMKAGMKLHYFFFFK